MSKPAVSIVIPTYNRAALLREALDSVGAQSFRDYEVIVVDDGSTEAIGTAIADHPTSPRVIRQERRGPAAARNRGIREAKAEFIAFLDSDDLWHPTKLEQFVGALQANDGIRIFYGPMQPMDAHGGPVAGRTKPCYSGWITEPLFCSSFVHVPTVVCRKDVLLRSGGFDEALSVCEDYDLWLRVSVEEPFGLIEEPLAKRRLHAGRLSKQCMSRNLAVKARVLRVFHDSGRADGRLDRRVAADRLARVCFVAARAALRSGQYRQAVAWCQASRAYGGRSLRTASMAIAATAMAMFTRGNRASAPDSPGDARYAELMQRDLS